MLIFFRYNSEIELSTDTDDSASETNADRRHSDLHRIGEALKPVDANTRGRVLELARSLVRQHEAATLESRAKTERIVLLESRISQLEQELKELRSSCTALITVNGEKEDEDELGEEESDVRESAVAAKVDEDKKIISSSISVSVVKATDGSDEGEGEKDEGEEDSCIVAEVAKAITTTMAEVTAVPE